MELDYQWNESLVILINRKSEWFDIEEIGSLLLAHLKGTESLVTASLNLTQTTKAIVPLHLFLSLNLNQGVQMTPITRW